MSVAEVKPRSRAALLAANLESLRAKRDAIQQRIVELPELEEQARLDALRLAPSTRTDTLNSPAQRLRGERIKKTAELDRLDAEISAVERSLSEAHVDELADQFAETEREAEKVARCEIALWKQADEQFRGLVETFGELRDLWEARDRRREVLRHGPLGSLINRSPEAEEAFEHAWRAPVRPLPVSVGDFAVYLVEAAVDPRGLGYREPGGQRLDAENRITALITDLRGDRVRPVELLRTEKRQAPSLPFGA